MGGGAAFLQLLPEAALLLSAPEPPEPVIILDCNEEICRWGGYSRDELVGMPLERCCTPLIGAAERVSALERLRDGQAVTVEVLYRRKDGSSYPVEFCASITSLDGRPVALALGRDRSEHHRTMQSLYENAQRLHLALYGANAGMWEWNIQTGRTLWSDENYRVLGLEPGSVESTYEHWLAAVHPDEREAVNAHVAMVVAEQADLYLEMRIVWPDGTVRWVADIGKILFDSAGNPERMIGLLVDITRQKEAEQEIRRLNAGLEERVRERTRELAMANQALGEAYARLEQLLRDLRSSRDVLRTIVDGLDDGLALLDRQGNVLIANQGIAAIYGLAPAAIHGRPWRSVCALTFALIEETLDDGLPRRARIRLKGSAERPMVLDARTFPIGSGDDLPEQVVLHLANVSERVQLEQLAITNDRLAASGRIAAIVAHEANTPLQSVQNILHLAAEDPAELPTLMDLAHDELGRVTTLIRRLLDLHRPGEHTRKPVDLNSLVERLLTLVNGTLVRQRVKVERDLAAELPLLWCRQDHIMQVLLNLLLNAADAMPGGGVVTIRTAVHPTPPPTPAGGLTWADEPGDQEPPLQLDPARSLEIAVIDRGEGIPEHLHEQIFEMFFTTKKEGSGLGLAISRQIVEQHGGRLAVTSRSGAGTTFSITLPILISDGAA